MRRRAAEAVASLVLLLTGCGDQGEDLGIPPPRNGVAIDIVFDEPASAELADVDRAADLGADSLRVAIQWPGMQPMAGGPLAAWYAGRLDALAARARERGLRLLLTPHFTPCWATSAGATSPGRCADPATAQRLQTSHPADPATFGHFVEALAKRYREDLVGIEVWNEPNLSSFWEQVNRAPAYVALVGAARRAVDRVAPEIPVVAGAVAGADVAFLKELRGAGLQEHDVLSVHLYNDGRPPEARIPAQFAAATFAQGLEDLARDLDLFGEQRPLWVTEIGWNTSTQRGRPFADGVGRRQQAAYLERAIGRLTDAGERQTGPDAVFVYRLRDHRAAPADPQQNYGLIDVSGTSKPAFEAVRRAFAQRRG